MDRGFHTQVRFDTLMAVLEEYDPLVTMVCSSVISTAVDCWTSIKLYTITTQKTVF
jgi:hypothetical protein